MKDLSWERIVGNCEKYIEYLQPASDVGQKTESRQYWLQSAQGLLSVVPMLRVHPELDEIPPMMSHLALRWLFDNRPEVDLFYDAVKGNFVVTIYRWHESIILQRIAVELNNVADTVWTSICRVKNGEI